MCNRRRAVPVHRNFKQPAVACRNDKTRAHADVPGGCDGRAAEAAQTVRLPDYLCGGSQGIFADGYETGGVFSSDPSMGSGGAYPGNHSRSFPFAVLGTQTYYLHVPPQYQSGQAMPVMLVLEGYTGSHASSVQEAQGMRDAWIGPADTYGFIVAAPVNNKRNGSWLPADGSGQTNDYDAIGAALDDLGQAYNIERNRVSVWGFSAGGHIAWDMLLNNGAFVRPTPLNAGTLASMSTSARKLAVCLQRYGGHLRGAFRRAAAQGAGGYPHRQLGPELCLDRR